MTDTADSITGELREYLYRTWADTPPKERGRWVMNAEWLSECRKLHDPGGFPLALPSLSPTGLNWLIGIPVEIRDDAGAPRLER